LLTNIKIEPTIKLGMRKLIVAGSSFFLFLFVTVAPAFAVTKVDPCPQGKDAGGVGFNVLCGLTLDGGIIGTLITIAFILAVIIALAFLIFGGIKWIISGGDKTKVEEARGTIVAALVGLILVFLAFFLINFLLRFFNLGDVGKLEVPNIKNCVPKGESCVRGGTRCCGSAVCSSVAGRTFKCN